MAKKICIFSAHYFPYLGGVERYTYHLAKELKKKGDQVIIVTSNDARLKAYEWMDGILVLRMPCINLLAGRFPITKPNREYFKLRRKLMRIVFDLVIVNTRFYPHSVDGLLLARKQKAKSILIDHGTSHMTIGSPFWDKLGNFYEHGITAVEKRLCQDFYGVSAASGHWLKHFGIVPRGTLYNAVDKGQIEELLRNPVRDFRKDCRIPADGIVVTYTGRLVREKGILNLIEAVKRCRRYQQLYLLIAGDGEELPQVRERASDHIIPLGQLPFAEVAALLQQTEIYCLPTDYPEGFPTALLEAAAAGCYLITTSRGSSQELILDDSYGMIMDNNRIGTITKALNMAAERPKYRLKAAQRAKERVFQLFTWDKTAEQVHRL